MVRLVVEVMWEVSTLMKVVVSVLELVPLWVVLELVEVEEVEVVEVELSMGEKLEVNLSRKVRCIQGTPKLVWKGIVGSSRRRSQYVDPLVVWVPLWVEFRSMVVAVGDGVGHVRRPVDPVLEVWVQIRLEWKMDILVERDLGEVGGKVDALEVLQDIGG